MTKPTPPRTPSALKLQITQAEWEQLYKNGLIQAKVKGTSKELDPVPVVKLFYPASAATWLLTEVEPEEPDIAWGLCDLGMGFPEFGTVSLQELAELKGFAGLRIERDRFFKAKAPISRYIEAARSAGQIVENLPDTARPKTATAAPKSPIPPALTTRALFWPTRGSRPRAVPPLIPPTHLKDPDMTPANTAPAETLDAAPESSKARIILDAATILLTSLAKGRSARRKAAARSHGAGHGRLRRRRRLVLERCL